MDDSAFGWAEDRAMSNDGNSYTHSSNPTIAVKVTALTSGPYMGGPIMEKRLIIGIAGSDGREFKDVAIVPNTRAIDVLNQLDLRGFQLAKPEGGMFAHKDNIYDAVSDGQKIYATKSDVEAGR